MDPAFCLADEIADVPHQLMDDPHTSLNGDYDDPYADADSHEHLHQQFTGSDTLGSLDAELENLHFAGGGDLASELDGFHDGAHGSGVTSGMTNDVARHHFVEGSLADELSVDTAAGESLSRTGPLAFAAAEYSSTGEACESSTAPSGTSTPSKHTLPRASGWSSPLRPTSSSFLSSATTATQTAEIQESIRSTDAFLRQLSSLSSSSAATSLHKDGSEASAVADAEFAGDTEVLEATASKFLKLVYECTLQREAQVRELRDLDRQFARSMAESAASASFSLSSSSSFGSGLGSVISGPGFFGSSADEHSASSVAGRELCGLAEEEYEYGEEEEGGYAMATSPMRRTKTLHRDFKSTASMGSDMTVTGGGEALVEASLFEPLHASTAALVASLGTLHEHSQVTKSSTADAARKLKALKALIGQWNAEQAAVDRSERWILQHGARLPLPDGADVPAWIALQLGYCAARFDDAEHRARVLLTPVSLAS
jgi:hypothetical protein